MRIDDEQLPGWSAAPGPVVTCSCTTRLQAGPAHNRCRARTKIVERRRLRRILEASGKVVAVFNGHLHWNHFDLSGGIPYITVQSLIENLDDDAPGRPAAAHAVCRLSDERLLVEIEGNDPARYQIELS